jgi:hypothetical protein
MTERYEQQNWQSALQSFTERNAGRRTRLEVDAPEIGAQQEEHDYPLRGVSYDPRDGRISIMLGRQGDTERRLTHGIEDARSVEVLRDERGRDHVLRVEHGTGQTLLRLI